MSVSSLNLLCEYGGLGPKKVHAQSQENEGSPRPSSWIVWLGDLTGPSLDHKTSSQSREKAVRT